MRLGILVKATILGVKGDGLRYGFKEAVTDHPQPNSVTGDA